MYVDLKVCLCQCVATLLNTMCIIGAVALEKSSAGDPNIDETAKLYRVCADNEAKFNFKFESQRKVNNLEV